MKEKLGKTSKISKYYGQDCRFLTKKINELIDNLLKPFLKYIKKNYLRGSVDFLNKCNGNTH